MAKYNLNNYLEKDGLGFPLNFRRGNPNPLDNSSVWPSLDAAKNYAQTDPVAYVGQILTVVETVVIDAEAGTTGTKVTAYSIQDEAGTLKEIGSGSAVVDNLQTEINTVNDKIGEVADGKTLVEMIADAEYDDTALAERVTANEEAIATLNGDETVEGSVDKKVADKVTAEINAFATNMSDDSVVNTFKELVDYVAEHGTEATNIAKDLSELKGLVGTTSVDDKISAAIANKVDVEEGKGLSSNDLTDALLSKLEGVAEGAQVNIIDSVDEAQFAIDENKKLTLLNIALDKVTGLTSALSNKVEKVEGSRLITASEAERLEALVLGDDGKVEISGTVNADNVQGLDDKLVLKVDKVTGKSLVDDTLIAKLETVSEGAQVNVIESIKINDTLLDITDKSVNIPVATDAFLGVVKASEEITVAADGTLGIGVISLDKIVQSDDEIIVLDGGYAG